MTTASEEIDFDPPETCPMCGSARTMFMGYLGKLRWNECRSCGMKFTDEEAHRASSEEDD